MQITYEQSRELTSRVIALQNDLIKAGLFKTHKVMHEVTKQIGWELAEIIEGDHPTKLVEESSVTS